MKFAQRLLVAFLPSVSLAYADLERWSKLGAELGIKPQ
jgi:hypothetical protein